MPTRLPERGSTGSTWPVRVSCRRIGSSHDAATLSRVPATPLAPADAPPAPIDFHPPPDDPPPPAHPAGPDGRVPAVAGRPEQIQRLSVVDEAFRSLPDRYLGADPGFDATYQITLCDLGHTWEVRCTSRAARVRKGGTRRRPDVTLVDRLRHLAAAAPRRVLRRGGVPAPAARRARQPGPGDRLRGDVQAGRRSPAAAADPRHPGRPPPHLDPHDGPRSRRAAVARAGRDARLAVRDRRRAQPLLPRARPRSARVRRPPASRPSAPTTRAGSPRSCSACSTNSRSTGPTWSGTRWAAGSRSNSAWSRRSGSARWACCVLPWPGSSAACTRSCASCGPSSACCPTRSAARRSPRISGGCSTTAT